MLAALEESESAVKASELRYRAVVEDQTELICRYLPDGTLTFANAACAAYLETSPGTLAGRNFFELFAPDGFRASTRPDGLIDPDALIISGEESVPGPDGGLRWIHWTGRAIVNGQGEVREIQAVGRDITERKQMEEALKQARDELEKRVEERTWQLLNTNERQRSSVDSCLIGPLPSSTARTAVTTGSSRKSLSESRSSNCYPIRRTNGPSST